MLFKDLRRWLFFKLHKLLRVYDVIVWLVEIGEFLLQWASSLWHRMVHGHQLSRSQLCVANHLLVFDLLHQVLNIVVMRDSFVLAWCWTTRWPFNSEVVLTKSSRARPLASLDMMHFLVLRDDALDLAVSFDHGSLLSLSDRCLGMQDVLRTLRL